MQDLSHDDREGRDTDSRDASWRALTDGDFWALVLLLLVVAALLA